MFGHGLLCFFTNIKIGAGGATSMLHIKNFCDEFVKQADGLYYTLCILAVVVQCNSHEAFLFMP